MKIRLAGLADTGSRPTQQRAHERDADDATLSCGLVTVGNNDLSSTDGRTVESIVSTQDTRKRRAVAEATSGPLSDTFDITTRTKRVL